MRNKNEFWLLLIILNSFNCEKDGLQNLSKESPFYKNITGCYTLEFLQEKTTMLAEFKEDSTFKINITGSSGREYFKGKWYLSDSLIFIDVTVSGGMECLSGDMYEIPDTTNSILFKWKLNEIKKNGFKCVKENNKIRNKIFLNAIKTAECDSILLL